MNISFTPQANPQFGMLTLAKDWDKSSQDVGVDKENQAKRLQNYKHLQTQQEYISTAYGQQFAQFENDLGLDFVIETQPTNDGGTPYTGKGDVKFQDDRFRINMIKRQNSEVLHSTSFDSFNSNQSVQYIADTIKSLIDKSVSQLKSSLEDV